MMEEEPAHLLHALSSAMEEPAQENGGKREVVDGGVEELQQGEDLAGDGAGPDIETAVGEEADSLLVEPSTDGDNVVVLGSEDGDVAVRVTACLASVDDIDQFFPFRRDVWLILRQF